jgi:hypothetical protein
VSVGHYLELPGARVIQTAELLLAGRAVRDLLAARAMGVLHGPAGSGKTFAAHVALDQLAVATAWVQFPAGRRCCTSRGGCIASSPAPTRAARTASTSPRT